MIRNQKYLETLTKDKLIQMILDLQRDSLTQTYKRDIIEYIDRELYTVCLVDFNSLKKINDKYGHYKGDEYLKSIANNISSNIRKGDILIRYGGDEFLVIFKNDISLETALKISKRFRNVSVGVGKSDKLEEAIRFADEEMYNNKKKFYQKIGVK